MKSCYTRSPICYVGNKYRLLPQILPLFPRKISTFVDLFCGGCTVSVNVKADKIRCNDINSRLIELLKVIRDTDTNDFILAVKQKIRQYKLSATNKKGYYLLREVYNKTPNPIDLFVLICYSFNKQMRFNSQHQFNRGFGRHKSRFSFQNEIELSLFSRLLKQKDIKFANKNFSSIDTSILNSGDFIYADPPYFITEADYCKEWTSKKEVHLYQYLDRVHDMGVKFALSNVIIHKGKSNDILLKWSKKYNLINLKFSYNNCMYNGYRGNSQEVLITNYDVPHCLFGK